MKNFVLEIFCEEIPAKLQKRAAGDLHKLVCEVLLGDNLNFDQKNLQIFSSPKRFGFGILNLSNEQIIPATQKIGPKVDANIKAVDGFLKSLNLKDVSQLVKVENKGNQYYAFETSETKIETKDILRESILKILPKLVNIWPRLMKWNIDGSLNYGQWIRPIRNILCIFDQENLKIEFAGVKSSNKTFFGLKNEEELIDSASSYLKLIKKNNIILNFEERRSFLVESINSKAKELSLKTIDENQSSLFDEVTGLCEVPKVLVGEIDQQFMTLPDEILVLTLKVNQKYFCLKDKKNNLSQNFIFVIDDISKNLDCKKIAYDNQKIVKARLHDAKFFIDDDLKKSLKERVEDLRQVVFHQKLGSIFDKTLRLTHLTKFLAIFVPHCDLSLIEKIAILSKADLTTKAVAEFPELQGKIGSFYALNNGEDDKVIAAIYEHYKPTSANSDLPKTALGVVLSIADKMDNIVGLFMVGEKPTSSKDPFALRRSVLGVIRIGFEHNIAFPIRILVEKTLKAYPNKLVDKYINKYPRAFYKTKHELVSDIIIFFVERLKAYLKENDGLHPEIVNAVIDHYLSDLDAHKYCDILYIAKKIRFLDQIVFGEKRAKIIDLYKRVANILKIEEKKDSRSYRGKPSKITFKTKEEALVFKSVKRISAKFIKLINKSEFDEAFEILKVIEAPLERFFENVVINHEDSKLRENRLILLSVIRDLFEKIYGLSKIDIP